MRPTGSNSIKGRRSRLGRSLGEALEKQLASYAAAASAAEVGRRARAPEMAQVITRVAGAVGAGLLLSAGPASARIVYTPAYTKVCPESVFSCSMGFPLDLDHDGTADFTLRFSPANSFNEFSGMAVSPAQEGNAILGNIQGVLSYRFGGPFTCRIASALPAGHRIGPGGPGSRFGSYQIMIGGYAFFPYGYYDALVQSRRRRVQPDSPLSELRCGNWPNTQAPFLGLEFTAQGQKHFGWARLNWVNRTPILTGYAYETEPNKPIRAGDTGPVADARVPEMHSVPPTVATLRPATLGLLALGSAGLDIWRKEL
jgi:hypothetical protein